MTDEPEIPAIFQDVSPEEIGRLAVASMAADEALDPEGGGSLSGISTGSLIAFASVRISETIAELINIGGHAVDDDTSVDEILNLVGAASLASYVEGFALASKLNELTQEENPA